DEIADDLRVAERNADFVRPAAERDVVVRRDVELAKDAEIQPREDVRVEHQERTFGTEVPRDQRQPPGRSERRRLAQIVDLEIPFRPVAEVLLDDVSQISHVDEQTPKPARLQRADDDLEEWTATDVQHGFGDGV